MRRLRPQLLTALLLFAWPGTSLMAQSQPSSQQQSPPPKPQTQSQPQTQTPAQASPDEKTDSVAEAARKAKAKKAAAAQGKVFTEEDLAGKKGGVSVVGNERKPRRTATANPDGDYEPNGEDYWRSRSQPILDAIAGTDQQIEQLKEDIKKYGNGGFDVQSGRNTTGKDLDVVYLHDRSAQIEQLQKHKAALQKQLEDLEEEGRKAGAPSAWFR